VSCALVFPPSRATVTCWPRARAGVAGSVSATGHSCQMIMGSTRDQSPHCLHVESPMSPACFLISTEFKQGNRVVEGPCLHIHLLMHVTATADIFTTPGFVPFWSSHASQKLATASPLCLAEAGISYLCTRACLSTRAARAWGLGSEPEPTIKGSQNPSRVVVFLPALHACRRWW
jgi:hypothetical protein